MDALRVAVVSRDHAVRLAAARAFDGAPPHWKIGLYQEPPVDADVVVTGPDADGIDGVPFDPTCTTDVLDAVARRAAARRGRVVAVCGFAGGVGATTVSIHLAAAFGAHGRSCVVELGDGILSRLGLPLEAARSNDELRPVPTPHGFDVVVDAAPRDAAGAYGFVVLDAGRDDPPRDVDVAVGILAPTLPGARRARILLERDPEVPWAIVTNRSGPGGEATRAELERVLGRRVTLELPCAPGLRDAEDDDRLMTVRWTRWGRRVSRLAAALAAE